MKHHLKGYNAPTSWPIKRKKTRYTGKPTPGPYALNESITLSLIIIEWLKHAKNLREVKIILNDGKVLINKKIIKDHKFPAGLFDVIELPDLKETYRIGINSYGKLAITKINGTNKKVYKINNKTILKNGRTQLNLTGGRNIIVKETNFRTGDSIIFDHENKKIVKHLKLENGARIFLNKGKHAGNVGTLEGMNKYEGMRKTDIKIKSKNGHIETLKEYGIVIDDSIEEAQ
ncbi:MAG: 30S ribosomal protein S4e [Nanoarchaeota archaeon]